jgi:methylated-DNA-[protein]-cysteine S-methyltransferase
VRVEEDAVVETRLLNLPLPEVASVEASPALQEALEQVGQYLQGLRQDFDLKLEFKGPPFYQTVWRTLRQVPYGQTISYGELAKLAGKAGGARAVGASMRRNPLLLLVPCHRVVGSGGKIGGFSYGLDWKRFLLDLEQRNSGREFLA